MITCRHCHAPLHTFVQPALVPWKRDTVKVECHQRDCALFMQTLDAEHYLTLDLSAYLKPCEVRA